MLKLKKLFDLLNFHYSVIQIIYYWPSSAKDSVESKGLPPWLETDSNFCPNDKCRIIWLTLNDDDENGCTSWTKHKKQQDIDFKYSL